jgi:hypothetical protein
MLVAAKTIAENFKANIDELSQVRTNWTSEYADDLISRIDDAIDNKLGVDQKKELRSATREILKIQEPAYRDILFFKTQIEDDFSDEPTKRDEILKTLGFTTDMKKISNGNQEGLIQLLSDFKTNMTESLKSEITGKGLNPVLIERIIGYSDIFIQANITQEQLKESTKEITQDIVETLNGIYDEVMGICKKASRYYYSNPIKRGLFLFARVIRNLGQKRKDSATSLIPD